MPTLANTSPVTMLAPAGLVSAVEYVVKKLVGGVTVWSNEGFALASPPSSEE